MKKNIIFLDIDGVLNCSSTKERIEGLVGIEDKKVDILKKIVDYLDADIVLISSWKEDWDVKNNPTPLGDYLDVKLLRAGLFIKDKTIDNRFDRGKGINKFLKEHDVDNFIILDDEEFDYYNAGLLRYWIKTSYFSSNGGLTNEIFANISSNKKKP